MKKVKADDIIEPEKKQPKKVNTLPKEFGGPIGTFMIFIFSHVVVYYLWFCVTENEGRIFFFNSSDAFRDFFSAVFEKARPTWWAFKVYGGLLLFEGILGVTLPGFSIEGLPIPSEGGKKLTYLCNAFQSWWVTLILLGFLQWRQYIELANVLNRLGELLTVAVIFADLLGVYVYISAIVEGKAIRRTSNAFYDYFMGVNLNPRIGILDIKIFCEVRMSWMLLFLLTLSSARKQYLEYGYVEWTSMGIMILAHGYYGNATAKGEELITPSWDIIHECFGWLLSFWNLAGVPFSYAFNSMFLAMHPPLRHNILYAICLYIVLLFAEWVHDTANAQKSKFRLDMRGLYKERFTFPQLPWSMVKNPKYLKTDCGSLLFIDGWYQYAQKIHYTADIVMALIWGLACNPLDNPGDFHLLTFFYFFFFLIMIIHRYHRDKDKMKRKYGKDYDRYTEIVPYVFVPGIY